MDDELLVAGNSSWWGRPERFQSQGAVSDIVDVVVDWTVVVGVEVLVDVEVDVEVEVEVEAGVEAAPLVGPTVVEVTNGAGTVTAGEGLVSGFPLWPWPPCAPAGFPPCSLSGASGASLSLVVPSLPA